MMMMMIMMVMIVVAMMIMTRLQDVIFYVDFCDSAEYDEEKAR